MEEWGEHLMMLTGWPADCALASVPRPLGSPGRLTGLLGYVPPAAYGRHLLSHSATDMMSHMMSIHSVSFNLSHKKTDGC